MSELNLDTIDSFGSKLLDEGIVERKGSKPVPDKKSSGSKKVFADLNPNEDNMDMVVKKLYDFLVEKEVPISIITDAYDYNVVTGIKRGNITTKSLTKILTVLNLDIEIVEKGKQSYDE